MEYDEIEGVVSRCQVDYRNGKVSRELEKIVATRQDLGTPSRGNFERDLCEYMEFQQNLKGFWNILKLVECNFDTLSRYIAANHDFDIAKLEADADSSTDEEEEEEKEDRGEADGAEEEEPPVKKQASENENVVTSSSPPSN